MKLRLGVEKIGGRALKLSCPGSSGVPDRLVILPGGQIIFIELKTKKGVLSASQIYQQYRLKCLGCDVRTLKGADEVEAFLKEVAADAVCTARISEENDTTDS